MTTPAIRRCFALLALLLGSLLARAVFAADGGGTVSGYVSNAASGNLLEGARVEVPQLGLVVFTDRNGQFTLDNLPAGTHQIVASYTGLDNVKADVAVARASARRETSISRRPSISSIHSR
jgi:hypothetical protein